VGAAARGTVGDGAVAGALALVGAPTLGQTGRQELLSPVLPLLVNPPVVSGVEPHEGPNGGGTKVTINGENLGAEPEVFFGAAAATSVEVKSEAEVVATSPSSTGFVDVTVKTLGGTSGAVSADTYTFTAPPPPHLIPVGVNIAGYCTNLGYTGKNGRGEGPASLRRNGEIEGANFAYENWACVESGGTEVPIEATGASLSMEDICAKQYPEDASFAYPTNPNNASTWNCYGIPPKVTSVAPHAIGPGGGLVKVKGEHLQGASAVEFDGSPGVVTTDSADEISVEAPAHSVGTVDVVVTTAGGPSPTSSSDHLTYVTGPAISEVEPTEGPAVGGTHVKVIGENLEDGTIDFSGVETTTVKDSANEMEVVAPPHAPGSVEVEFEGPAGKAVGGATHRYAYLAPRPSVSGVSPAKGPAAGGTTVTITGEDLEGTTKVTLGGLAATEVHPLSSTEVTAQSPAHSAGKVHVVVTTPSGDSEATSADEFTYVAAPKVTSVAPGEGPEAGGTKVAIKGEHLAGASEVKFGSATAIAVEPKSDTEVVATSPAGAGTVHIMVTAPGGTSATSAADEFEYRAPPSVTAVTPAEGGETGGTKVRVLGTNLEGASDVTFAGVTALIHKDSAGEIEVETPGHAEGEVEVCAKTAGGLGCKAAAFAYIAPPKLSLLGPTEGRTAGHTLITISGEHLEHTHLVTFGGIGGAIVTRSETKLEVEDPGHAAGEVEVCVVSAGGSACKPNAFTYVAAPTVSTVTPEEGPEAGHTTVKISGTNLENASEVLFGGHAAKILHDSSGEVEAETPTLAGGSVEVCVVTSGGSGCKSEAFTYRPGPTVSAVTPDEGPTGGGTKVKLLGTNLENASEVTFGGSKAAIRSDAAGELEVETPGHAAGEVEVCVKTAGGQGCKASAFSYLGLPKISSLAPPEGPTAGHTLVTITGEHLDRVHAVTFDELGATIVAHSETKLEVETPGHAAGEVEVCVGSAGGSACKSGAFKYLGQPTVSSASPSEGPEAGHTKVKLSGTNLGGASEVTFGGHAATILNDSAGEVEVETPALAAGSVAVCVVTAGGSGCKEEAFTYRPPPTVSSVTPGEGPAAGGTAVAVKGEHFVGHVEVKFGSVKASGVEVKSEDEVRATSPAGANTVQVTVVTAGGESATSPADEFTFRAAPKVSSISPNEGPVAGATKVAIKGEHFAGSVEVKFGSSPASGVELKSETEVVATSPGGAGKVHVTVTTAGGTSAPSGADEFTYRVAPTLASVTPSEGLTEGHTPVKVTGEHLEGTNNQVTFGGALATIKKDTAGEIEVEAPAHVEGTVEVCVITPGGQICKAGAFSYHGPPPPPPVVSGAAPAEGPASGGTKVKVSGTELGGATAVSFGGAAAKVLKNGSGEAEVETPAHAAGAVEVCVTTGGGSNCKAAAFTYVALPAVVSISPSEGPVAGGTTVTISGEHLKGASEVRFGAAKASGVEVKSETEVKAKSPAGSGRVPVTLTTVGGTSATSAAGEFTYRALPKVSSIAPKEGPTAGGATVIVKGEHLEAASEVRFGSRKAATVEAKSEGELEAVSPEGTPGAVDVVVNTAGGESAKEPADHYAYVARPVVTSVVPNQGPASGGISVSVRGEHLEHTTAVKFGEASAGSLHVVSAGEVTVKSPVHGAGTVAVVVTTPGGESTGTSDGFTYSAPLPRPPKVFSISPSQGATGGGTPVTIKGEHFEGASAVKFGASAATGVVVQSETELTATSPAGSGTVDVTVTTPGGTSATSPNDAFTFVNVSPGGGGGGGGGESANAHVAAAAPSGPTGESVPAPVLAGSGNVARVSGTVLVELPGTTAFVPLTSLRQIPFGSVINAINGRVSVTTAAPHGGTQIGEFFDGEFILTQKRNGEVVATLTGGDFSVCPRRGGAAKARHARGSGKKASGKHVVRKLGANAHGSFSTKGNYAVGAVQGTEWLTEDLCEGTLIRVTRDKVKVTNLVNHRHLVVRAGRHYLAKAP
jgi:hypothetical protein